MLMLKDVGVEPIPNYTRDIKKGIVRWDAYFYVPDPDALAQEDKTLKVVLQLHFASIENANITREVKDGKLTVTIVKRAQHKGA